MGNLENVIGFWTNLDTSSVTGCSACSNGSTWGYLRVLGTDTYVYKVYLLYRDYTCSVLRYRLKQVGIPYSIEVE